MRRRSSSIHQGRLDVVSLPIERVVGAIGNVMVGSGACGCHSGICGGGCGCSGACGRSNGGTCGDGGGGRRACGGAGGGIDMVEQQSGQRVSFAGAALASLAGFGTDAAYCGKFSNLSHPKVPEQALMDNVTVLCLEVLSSIHDVCNI
jgi:hypothetical protein